MWALRGAQRRDLRYEHLNVGNRYIQHMYLDVQMMDEFVEFGEADTDEKSLPLCRSPVYPPEDLINTMFSGLSVSTDSPEDSSVRAAESNAMADFAVSINEDVDIISSSVESAPCGEESEDSDSDIDSDQSDSDMDQPYGSTWKTSTVSVSREALELYERGRLSRKFFRTVMRNFKFLFLSIASPDKIPIVAKQMSGKPLALRFPENWYLLPQKASKIRVLKNVDISEYVCCDTTLIPLGACAARSPDLHFRETPCAMLMDTQGRFFLYDSESDGMYFAANNIEQLARQGLSLCEPVYRDGGAVVSMPHPRTPVKKLISAAIVGLDNVTAVTAAYKGVTVKLCDPATGHRVDFQIFGRDELMRKMPFATLSKRTYDQLMDFIDFRLCEAWTVIGGLGEFPNNELVFIVSTLVILGSHGAVYGFCLKQNDIYKLADEMAVFFKKGVNNEAGRFDRGAIGELRLEKRPKCPHWESKSQRAMRVSGLRITRRDLYTWYRWNLRTKPKTSDMVSISNISEAKRQFTHPAKGIPVVVVTGESYQPKEEREEAFETLSDGIPGYRYPRLVDESCDETYEIYRKFTRPRGLDMEKTEREVLRERAERIHTLQKTSTPLKLPPISSKILYSEHYEDPMSDR